MSGKIRKKNFNFFTSRVQHSIHNLVIFLNMAKKLTLKKNVFHFTAALAFGAKESSMANNIFTITNLSVVLFVIIAGAFKGTQNFEEYENKF